MTNLEAFLKNEKEKPNLPKEPASGSFSCQHEDCDEIINDGYIDRYNNRLHWTCVYGHESSVVV
jgi:hypothetical protein